MASPISIALGQHWLRLTHREREILLWVGDGMSNKEIAQRLGLSVGTVKIHVHSIFQKTGARNRYELFAELAARSVA
jgi:two-component system nitrate/nitrite response regulator NarP